MDIEKAKQKIKKLLALSKSPNENEAFAALEKAKQLMEEYGLSEQSSIYTSNKIKATKTYTPWRTIIANAIAWLYNCYTYRDRDDGTFVFSGEEFDVFMAGEMYTYLIKTTERIAKQKIRKNAKYTFRKSYKQGIASRLYDRIMELGKACSWAPQRETKIKAVTEFIKKQFDIETISPKKKVKINGMAMSRGFRDADGISLTAKQQEAEDALLVVTDGDHQNKITSMSAAVRKVIDDYPAGHQFFGNELKDDVVNIFPEAVNMYPDTILRMARRHRRDSFRVVDQNNSLYEKVAVVTCDIIPKTISCPSLPRFFEKPLQMDLFAI